MLEKEIENKVCKHARKMGYMVCKQDWPGRRGAPDRLFVSRGGVAFMVEFKSARGRLSKNQERVIKELTRRDFPVYIIDNVETGVSLLELYAPTL